MVTSPRAEQGLYGRNYAKTASVQLEDVFNNASWTRRLAIDMGDITAEMEATYVLAQLSLYEESRGKTVNGFGWLIESQRLDLLSDALGELSA